MASDVTDGPHGEMLRKLSLDPTDQIPISPSKTSASESVISTPTEGPNTQDESDAQGFNLGPYRRHLPGDQDLPPIEIFTDKDSLFYNIDAGERLVIVFNHSEFKHDRMPARAGTNRDVEAIQETFQKLSFKVEVYNNLSVDQIIVVLINLQSRKHLSCLALFILSHGEEDGLLYAYDSNYKLNKTIVRELLPDVCPSLAGKPKMIFIQACQGDDIDGGVLLRTAKRDRTRHTSTDSSTTNLPYCIPNHSDLLIFSASFAGHYSFRSKTQGSWFIQALCREIRDADPSEDLISVLTKVSFFVAVYKESVVPDTPALDRKKQIPLKQDTLIRKIYLKSTPKEMQELKKSCVKETNSGDGNRPNLAKGKDNCLCM